SSCMYPKAAPQPMAPDALWAGALEPTSRAYATARLAGVELVRALRIQYGVGYIAAIPADAFGPDEPFDAENAHVVPALIRRCVEAREQGARSLTVWGSGRPVRELIYADDVADACLCLLERYDDPAPINIGSGWEMSVAQLAETIRDIVGYRGELQFDPGKPDGAPRKTFDSTRLAALGWKPRWQLRDALRATYEAYCKQRETQHAS
ncbi:MAG: NAD-dependent epimerase/dehydratase family protein, partial [Polyangiales bacterium]